MQDFGNQYRLSSQGGTMFRRNSFFAFMLAPIIAATPSFAQPISAEVFGNTQVIEMHQLGLPDAAVIAKIKSVNGKYDTSIKAMKALKAAGISGEIITAMLESQQKPTAPVAAPMSGLPSRFQPDPNDPMAQYEPGNYIKSEDGSLLKMEAGKVTAQGPSGAAMFIPFAGLAAKTKWYFNDVSPVVTTSRRPEFTFYFATKVDGQNLFAQLPLENMVIVKLERDDNRLMLTQRVFGKLSKGMIRLKLEKVYKTTIYKAVVDSDLPDGDYALGNYDFDAGKSGAMGSGSIAGAQFVIHGLYPFTVKGGEAK